MTIAELLLPEVDQEMATITTDATMNQTEMDMATVPPEQMNTEAASRAQPAIYGPSADEGM